MPDPIVTLTTDFGEESPYVAALKGVLLSLNPCARLVDLSHQVPPQNLRHTAFFLAAALPYWAPDVLHVVVVDPGVGSERAILYVDTGRQRLLVPDNGCWTALLLPDDPPPAVTRVTEPRYWRPQVSATFHGRDIFAPVAAHLSLGLGPNLLGPSVTEWSRLELPQPRRIEDGWQGEVLFVDHFGNLITNLSAEQVIGTPQRLTVGGNELAAGTFRQVRTYAEAEPGALVVLASSTGLFEIAVVQGSAARRLNVGEAAAVFVGPPRTRPNP